jgi:PAS domain S-box-containing protein
MQLKAGRLAFKVALIYVIVAGCWILFSDELMAIFISNPDERTYLSIIKGWAFVIVTGGLLHQVLRRLLQRWEREVEQRIRAEVAHQEAGEALRESEKRFVNLFQKAPLSYQSLDADGRFIEVNEAWLATLGYTRAEVIGKRFEDFLAPEFVAAFRQRFPIFKAAGSNYSEFEMLHRNGERRFIAFEGRIGHKQDGSFQQTHCILQDITGRKRAADALRESQALYYSLVEQLPIGIFRKDPAGRYVLVNSWFCRLKGMAAEEFLGKTPQEVSGGETAKSDVTGLATKYAVEGEEHHRLIMETGQPIELDEEYSIAGGQKQFVHAIKLPVFNPDGKVIGTQGALFDITEHKRAVEALRESETQLRAILESTADGILAVDNKGKVLQASPRFAELWRIPQSLMECGDDRTLLDFVLGQVTDPDAFLKKVQSLYGSDALDMDMLAFKDGRIFERYSFPMIMDGAPVGRVWSFRDITGRKRAEEIIIRERELLRTLIDLLPETFYVKALDSRFLIVNETLAKQYGKDTPAQIIGLSDADLFPAGLAARFRAEEMKIFAGEPLISHEDSMVFLDGRTHTILTTKLPFRDSQGRICGLVGIGQDITERKQAEDMLRETARQLLEAQHIASLGSYILDVKTGGWTSSEVLDELFGIVDPGFTKDVTGWLQIVHPQDRAEMQRYLNDEVLKGHAAFDRNYRIVRLNDQQERWVHGLGKVVFDDHGQAVQMEGIIQDITEWKRLEEQLRQAQKMEAIGQLASGVAHDFNNILAVIQLQAGLLKAEQNLSLQQLDFAGEIEQAAQRAANLTRQLLLFSRKQALQLRDLDLNEVVTSITKMLQRILGEDAQMQFKFSPQPLLVHADAGMMDQVLMNLTVNARDAMPKGGRLIIETSAVEFDEVTAAQTSQARPGSFACVSVSDNGCGIPPEILPRIFEPFFTTKEPGKGTGLGLATVFGIVQQHQGWINVYSEAGQGTTFRIYLSRLTKASDKKANWSSLASIRSGNETILLVEDDSSLRASIRIALSRLGYRVLEASNGVAALEVWKQHRDEIRLLLTDLVMPGGMTGKELADQLLQSDSKLKVVYVSGYSAEIASKDFLLEEGVNFLAKPFAAHQLAQTIRNCLDKI